MPLAAGVVSPLTIEVGLPPKTVPPCYFSIRSRAVSVL
jgi:hypothetical protein